MGFRELLPKAIEYNLQIQFQLYFFFRLTLHLFHQIWLDGWQIFCGTNTEVPQELFGRSEQDRTARRIQTARFPHQPVLYQTIQAWSELTPRIFSTS